jgi:hypothetical protein
VPCADSKPRLVLLNDEYPESLLSAVSKSAFSESHLPPEYAWQSPLTSQWTDGLSGTCLETPIRALGRMVQRWVTMLLNNGGGACQHTEATLRERAAVRKDIERFLDVRITVSGAGTAMLSSCQWAARVMLRAEQQRLPIRAAAAQIVANPRLVTCLRTTDLDGLWADNMGMLFWVVCICHRATSRKCFPLLTTGLLSRFAHIVAQSQQYHTAALEPVKRLEMFERLCSKPEQPSHDNA